MAVVTININSIDATWAGASGAVTNIDETIAGADAAVYGPGPNVDAADFGLSAHGRSDGDTITNVGITVRLADNGTAGTLTADVELLIGGTTQGTVTTASLSGTMANYGPLNIAGWNSDWTAAQLTGAQIRITPQQSGMPGTNALDIDCADVIITYDVATVSATYDQDSYQGFADGTEAGATSLAAANTTWPQQLDEIISIRYLINQTATAATTGLALTVKPQFRVDTGAGFSAWADVTAATSLQFANSTSLTDGGATTERMAGAGTFIAGEIGESATQTMTFTNPSTSEDTEFLFVVLADSAQLNREDIVEVKVVLSSGSADLDTITNTASFTIEGPIAAGVPDTLNFTGLLGLAKTAHVIEAGSQDTFNFTGLLGVSDVGIGITETSLNPDTLNFTGLAGATGNFGNTETSLNPDTLNFTGLTGTVIAIQGAQVKTRMRGNIKISGNMNWLK